MKISDKVSLTWLLEGELIPLEVFTFRMFKMISSIDFFVPVFELSIADPYGYFSKKPLGENQFSEIILGFAEQDPVSYFCRVTKKIHRTEGNLSYYTIRFVFNSPEYIVQNIDRSFPKMTSAEAIKQAAPGVIFKSFDIDDTNDRQTWISVSEKVCIFLHKIKQYGYVDKASCMQIGVTIDGEFRYKNISELDYDDAETLMEGINLEEGSYPVIERKDRNTSSIINTVTGGYKKLFIEQSPVKNKVFDNEVYGEVEIKAVNDSVMLNENIYGGVSGSVVRHSPIDCGNTHENYLRAYYQNSRIFSYYTDYIDAVVPMPVPLDVLDPVKYTAMSTNINNEAEKDEAVSGNYLVKSKIILISGSGVYYEKFGLIRSGVNGDIPESLKKA